MQESEEGEAVEGYHVLIGGGFGPYAALGRELYRNVKAEDAPQTVERILKAYLAHRASQDESFIAFARRHEIDTLKACRAGGRMSITPRPPIPSFLPETAPFTPEQRAWLNGLFAGVFGLEGGVTPLSKADVAKLLPDLVDAPAQVPAEVDDGAPWHDPACRCRPHETRRRSAVAAADDGGDGATGLRPVRL